MRLFLLLCSIILSTPALAQPVACDCQTIVGNCQASIRVIPTKAENGNHAATLQIQSTAPNCSKVEYYLDNTPYFTILSRGNQGEDSIFGQRPITRNTISDISCKVCKRADEQAKPPVGGGREGNMTERGFQGRWQASSCPGAPGWWGSGGPPRNVTITLSLSGNSLSGQVNEQSSAYQYSATLSGSITGDEASLSSSVQSTHKMTLSPDKNTLTDSWCNKDGGCAVCVMQRQ